MIYNYNNFLESLKQNNMMNIIPNSVKDLHKLFSKNGKKLYLVGGAVRDFLNNETPKDFDLCTDALPEEILSMIGNAYKVNLQGKQFGVIVVYTKDQPEGIEIATFRTDEYGDKLGSSRNPDVKFSTIDKDVLRRDIPFNAMFYDLDTNEIVDLVGGQEDIKNKITRFVGDPDLRIEEDPLRILRIFRFSSRYEFSIDKDTSDSIRRNKSKLSIISRERVIDEIKKSFKQSKDFNYYLNLFTEFDMWEDVFPNSIINTNLINSKDFIVVMANLFKNDNLNSLENKLIQDYKIESDLATKIVFLIKLLSFNIDDVFDVYKKRQQCGVSNKTILEWLNTQGISNNVLISFVDYIPSVSARELMNKGFKGKELGDEIKRLEIEKFRNTL